jgi:hypothetical protein
MNAKDRKERPLYSGLLKYFPRALQAVAHCSWVGNEQHNPGEPLYWNRAKSTDEPDALMRHLLDAGTVDGDGVRHSTKVAWRALAMLEKELEAAEEAAGRATPRHTGTVFCICAKCEAIRANHRARYIAEKLVEKKKGPSSEEKRPYGEALGGWVPGATPRREDPSDELMRAGLAAQCGTRYDGAHPAFLPPGRVVGAQTSGPCSELRPNPESARLRPSPPSGRPGGASPPSPPGPEHAGRPANSTPTHPSSRPPIAPLPPEHWAEWDDPQT